MSSKKPGACPVTWGGGGERLQLERKETRECARPLRASSFLLRDKAPFCVHPPLLVPTTVLMPAPFPLSWIPVGSVKGGQSSAIKAAPLSEHPPP